jgi:hypothetical protein
MSSRSVRSSLCDSAIGVGSTPGAGPTGLPHRLLRAIDRLVGVAVSRNEVHAAMFAPMRANRARHLCGPVPDRAFAEAETARDVLHKSRANVLVRASGYGDDMKHEAS